MSEIQHRNPKLAILFFGIHYLKNYKHWMPEWNPTIDFRKSVDNYKEYIFEYFNDYDIDTFFSTYESEKLLELVDTYKPKSYKTAVLDNNGKNHTPQRNERFIEVLELAKQYETEQNFQYDLYLITRFDLNFILDFNKLKVATDRLNISYRTGCGEDKNLVDDNFYIISQGNLDKLITIAKDIPKHIWFHKLHEYNGDFKINFMIDGFYYSHESPLYKFIR